MSKEVVERIYHYLVLSKYIYTEYNHDSQEKQMTLICIDHQFKGFIINQRHYSNFRHTLPLQDISSMMSYLYYV